MRAKADRMLSRSSVVGAQVGSSRQSKVRIGELPKAPGSMDVWVVGAPVGRGKVQPQKDLPKKGMGDGSVSERGRRCRKEGEDGGAMREI